MRLNSARSGRLGALDVLRLQTAIAGDGLKGHGFALVQRFVASAKDGGMMHKNILSGVLDDESKTLLVVKPFNFAACHSCSIPDLRGRLKAKNDTTGIVVPLNYFPELLMPQLLCNGQAYSVAFPSEMSSAFWPDLLGAPWRNAWQPIGCWVFDAGCRVFFPSFLP
jgi:hypothetical protein